MSEETEQSSNTYKPRKINKSFLIDLDALKYSAAHGAQTDYIYAENIHTGEQTYAKSTTEFWGKGKHPETPGGVLAIRNFENNTDWKKTDFIIHKNTKLEDVQVVYNSIDSKIKWLTSISGKKRWQGFVGEGQSFRVGLSTLWEYKGRRPSKPHYFKEAIDYIKAEYNPEIVTDIEVDDRLVMIAHKRNNYCIVGSDKDYYGNEVNYLPIGLYKHVRCQGFGELSRENYKGKINGYGRLWKYFQILFGDIVDNYKANCFSELEWGEVSAYEALRFCKDDKQAWKVLVECFKKLYPEKKVVKGWRGEDIEIDWFYVLQEMTNMAHMHRWDNDLIDVEKVLIKLGIECGRK